METKSKEENLLYHSKTSKLKSKYPIGTETYMEDFNKIKCPNCSTELIDRKGWPYCTKCDEDFSEEELK